MITDVQIMAAMKVLVGAENPCGATAVRAALKAAENAAWRPISEAQEDESSMLLIAHMNGAAQGRRAGLEEAAKIVHQLGKDRGVPGAHINAMVAAIRARMGEA